MISFAPSAEFSDAKVLNLGKQSSAQMPLRRIHERGRMISASTMPPSLRSTVIESLAHVAWSGSDCGSTSKRLGFLVGTRDPIGTDSMGAAI